MSLEYAILGFLQYKPISGYDMKKMFDTSIKHFWPADQSQIYRTLSKLKKEDLIDMKLIIQENRPNSKIYSLTEKGEEVFLNWLSKPVGIEESRVPWLMQVFFAARLSDDMIISIFQQTAKQIRRKTVAHEEITRLQSIVDDESLSQRDLFFIELTYDYGSMLRNSVLQWIEKAIKRIEEKKYIL